MIVTRYAPSPTGNPHVGNIRTAIFAYLHAKSSNGKFLLRIEDTDRARFVPEAIKYIEESLDWLGIAFDDEKIFQSDRLPKYQELAEKLLKEKKAYKCFCSSERLADLRKEQESKGLPPGYDKKCRKLTDKEINEKESAGEKYVIRFAMPEKGKAIWDDLIRGKVEIEYSLSDDPVIIKSDSWPTYHLANVIDDHELGITDVIRAEEWIPSTPKHLAIYDAFGWNPPKFAHMSHIVGKDHSKLSKRHGDTAILDYREKGYLPEAMFNFLATLGWNDGTEKEIFTKEELLKSFDIKRVNKAPAVFDIDKLNWINGLYIRNMETKKLAQVLSDMWPKEPIVKAENFEKIVEVEKNRLVTLSDIKEGIEFYKELPKYQPELLVFKKSNPKDTKTGLTESLSVLCYFEVAKWSKMTIEDFNDVLSEVVKKTGLSNGDIFWPVRVALSGKDKSPSPAELLWVLEKDESIQRLQTAIDRLK